MNNQPISEPTAAELSARRDALARVLCARIADERKTIPVLQVIDELLTRIENDDARGLVETLQRMVLEHVPDDYTRGWNAAMSNAVAAARINAGLTELRRQSQWPDEDSEPEQWPAGMPCAGCYKVTVAGMWLCIACQEQKRREDDERAAEAIRVAERAGV